jgi:hypothetical protein
MGNLSSSHSITIEETIMTAYGSTDKRRMDYAGKKANDEEAKVEKGYDGFY